METIILDEIGSGEDEFCVWISLGFKSKISEYDQLFIVCSSLPDIEDSENGTNGLYYERHDQIMSCCSGAHCINFDRSETAIHFTKTGADTLKLPVKVSFSHSALPKSQIDTLHHYFSKMAATSNGSVITLV